MNGYRQTFRKHRILYSVPPLVAALALAFVAFGSGKKYESYASLWIDNGPLVGSSLDNNSSASQPSGAEQTLLNELLSTKNFALDVGNASALRGYIKGQGGTVQQFQGNLAAAVKSGTTSTAPGPQVLELSFTGASPQIAESTLQSLISHLQGSMTQYGAAFGQAARSYYQAQVTAANDAVTKATAAATAYLRGHPGTTSSSNQTYAALLAAQQSATGQLASATTQLNQATGQATGAGTTTLVRVIDPPSLPTTPTAGKKKAAEEIAAGLVGGILVSFLIIVALTPTREDRWDAEVDGDELTGVAQVQSAGTAQTRRPYRYRAEADPVVVPAPTVSPATLPPVPAPVAAAQAPVDPDAEVATEVEEPAEQVTVNSGHRRRSLGRFAHAATSRGTAS